MPFEGLNRTSPRQTLQERPGDAEVARALLEGFGLPGELEKSISDKIRSLPEERTAELARAIKKVFEPTDRSAS
jgi:hypothetical protein